MTYSGPGMASSMKEVMSGHAGALQCLGLWKSFRMTLLCNGVLVSLMPGPLNTSDVLDIFFWWLCLTAAWMLILVLVLIGYVGESSLSRSSEMYSDSGMYFLVTALGVLLLQICIPDSCSFSYVVSIWLCLDPLLYSEGNVCYSSSALCWDCCLYLMLSSPILYSSLENCLF